MSPFPELSPLHLWVQKSNYQLIPWEVKRKAEFAFKVISLEELISFSHPSQCSCLGAAENKPELSGCVSARELAMPQTETGTACHLGSGSPACGFGSGRAEWNEHVSEKNPSSSGPFKETVFFLAYPTQVPDGP